MSSPASSIRTCTFICRSWARSRRTLTRRRASAALVGGTTTLIEMICPRATVSKPMEAFELWLGKAQGKSACDFTFHMGVTRYDAGTQKAISRNREARHQLSFKIFLAYKGAFGITDEELYRTLKLAKELGVIVTAHCENGTSCSSCRRNCWAKAKPDRSFITGAGRRVVEAEGVHHLMTFAEMTGAHVYIVHISCEEALQRSASAARQRGVNVWVETLIQYLLLDRDRRRTPNFEGAKYVMSPPLRDKQNQQVLWNALADGTVATARHRSCAVRFRHPKADGQRRFHENSERHSVARRSGESAISPTA